MKKLTKSLLKNKITVLGLAIVLLSILFSIIGPSLSHYDPNSDRLESRLRPPGYIDKEGNVYLLGTDYLGRDILTRILYGGRLSIIISFTATVFSMLLGTFLGLISGLFGKYIDTVIMRLADVQLSFPFILLAVVAVSLLKPSLTSIIFVLTLSGWVRFTRLVRSEVMVLREKEFVQSGRAVGVPTWLIITRYLLPNVSSSIIVMATLEMSRMIIMEATLGFLGLGIPAPTATWGGMISDGRSYFSTAWWISVFPGFAIFFLVFGINLMGDWFRDYLDPKLCS